MWRILVCAGLFFWTAAPAPSFGAEAQAAAPAPVSAVPAAQQPSPVPASEAPAAVPADPLAKIVSLDFKDIDINAALQALSKSYKLNILVGKGISGKITVNLKDVPLKTALDTILASQNCYYTFSKDGSVIMIEARRDEMVTKVVDIPFGEAEMIKAVLEKVVSDKGAIVVDERLSKMVIKDYQRNIDENILPLVRELSAPVPQVLIEAKLVDITRQALKNLGVKWKSVYANTKESWQRNEGTADVTRQTADVTYNLPGPSSTLSGGQMVLGVSDLFERVQLSGTLDALFQNRQARLLSSPSIATLNNMKAKIVIGQKVAIKEQTQTTTGTTETIRFIDVGIALEVLPQIHPNKEITMQLHPEVSSIESFVDNLPLISTRQADTNVRVRDCQTIIIGGLMRDETSNTTSMIPILGQIPILGWPFRAIGRDRKQVELVIFITPRLIRTDEGDGSQQGAVSSQNDLPAIAAKHRKLVKNFTNDPNLNQNADSLLTLSSHENLIDEMMARARENEKLAPRVPEPRRTELFREALALYVEIATKYPQYLQADEALFRAGEIYFKRFKDYAAAKPLYEDLASRYPTSRHMHTAFWRLQRIDSRLRSQEKDALKKRLKEEQAAAKQQTVPEAEELLPAPENAPASAAVVREQPAAAVQAPAVPAEKTPAAAPAN